MKKSTFLLVIVPVFFILVNVIPAKGNEQLSGPQFVTPQEILLPNGLTVVMAPQYTTVDDPSNHTTGPGGPLDGVGDLFLLTSGGAFRCTGTLLEITRVHVLTAAHCVTDSSGNFTLLDGSSVTFEGDLGNQVIPINEMWTAVHPDWDGDFVRGNDIAILELDFPPTYDITGYLIDTNMTDDIGSMPVQVGYGRTGTGLTGDVLPSGTKHDVKNLFDSDSDDMNQNLLGETPGVTTVADSVLITDFDNGTAAHDACGVWSSLGFGFVCPADLGKGIDEGISAPGDSGGPSFTAEGPNTITGVTSYGITFFFPGQSDIDNELNSSFGEFAGYTRVAYFADWIGDVIDASGKFDAFVSMGTGNTYPESGSVAMANFDSGMLRQKSDSLTNASLDGIAFKDNGQLYAINATHLFAVNSTTGDLKNITRITNFADGMPFAENVIDLTADPAGSNQLDILSWNGTQYTFNILLEDGRVFETGITSKCDQQVGSLAWLTPDSIIFSFIPANVSCPTSNPSEDSLMVENKVGVQENEIWLVEREIIRGNPPSLGFINTWIIDEFYDGLSVNSTGAIFATSENGIFELNCVDGSPIGSCTSTLVAGNGTNPDDIDFSP